MSDLISALQQKRQLYLEAIRAIDKLLAIESCGSISPLEPTAEITRPRSVAVGARKNATKTSMSRKEVLRLVLAQAGKPLGMSEVYESMKRMGVKFQATNAKNAVNNLLYGNRRPSFVAKTDAGFRLK